MTKLIITVEKNTEIAKKILKGWQFTAYKVKLNVFHGLIMKKLSKFNTTDEKKGVEFYEEGDNEYIELVKRKFENFIFSDYDSLKTDQNKEYSAIVNDRIIQKVNRGAHKLKDSIKKKAIRAALGGGDVLGFFTRVGILISWKVENNDG